MIKLIYKLIIICIVMVGIAACEGGGSGTAASGTAASGTQTQALKSVTGVFIDDNNMPIARAVITVTDAEGVTREVTTDDNGLYYVEVNDLKLPLLVVGTYTAGGVENAQYSLVSADKSTADTVTANINEYTTLLVSAMTQEAGVALDTAPEALDDTTRNLILGVDYLPTIASMEELFCSVLLNPDGTPQGCEWGSSEDILTTSYVPTVDGTSIDKLVALMDVTVDSTTGDITITDSTGVPVATVALDEIVADTVPDDTLTPTDADNLEAVYTPPATITPIENEDVVAQISTDGRVRGYVDYSSNTLTADIMIENLSSCPGERRNTVVTPGDNAAIPSLISPDYDWFDVLDRSMGSIGPIDACRPYEFDYQFDYNLVIRKTQTGLVDGVPVWEYDNPECAQYSIKELEKILQETYQNTNVDFDLLFESQRPYIEVRPALHRYPASFPPVGMSFVYDPTCPMIADFSMTPTEGTPSLTVNVDASNSVGNLVSYEWEATGWQVAMNATGPTTSFTFDTAGTYTIELTVTDTNGQTDVLSKTVIVDPLPEASFTWILGSASNQVKVNAVNSTGTGISYSWTTSDGQTATGQNVDFTFPAPGDYTITLVVTDQYENDSEPMNKVVTAEEVTINCETFDPVTGLGEEGCYLPSTHIKTGLWTVRNVDNVSTTTYDNDIRHGPYTYTWDVGYSSGTETGSFLNGQIDGVWDYMVDNNYHRINTYSNGQLNGYYEYESFTSFDGFEHVIGNYLDNERHGTWTYSYPDGSSYTYIYINGVKQQQNQKKLMVRLN